MQKAPAHSYRVTNVNYASLAVWVPFVCTFHRRCGQNNVSLQPNLNVGFRRACAKSHSHNPLLLAYWLASCISVLTTIYYSFRIRQTNYTKRRKIRRTTMPIFNLRGDPGGADAPGAGTAAAAASTSAAGAASAAEESFPEIKGRVESKLMSMWHNVKYGNGVVVTAFLRCDREFEWDEVLKCSQCQAGWIIQMLLPAGISFFFENINLDRHSI